MRYLGDGKVLLFIRQLEGVAVLLVDEKLPLIAWSSWPGVATVGSHSKSLASPVQPFEVDQPLKTTT